MNLTVGRQVRYMGPYDVCAGYAVHPYGGKTGRIIALVTDKPLPPRPITIEFPDGTVVTATETEVRDPSLPY